jgi:hypothetical protein
MPVTDKDNCVENQSIPFRVGTSHVTVFDGVRIEITELSRIFEY